MNTFAIPAATWIATVWSAIDVDLLLVRPWLSAERPPYAALSAWTCTPSLSVRFRGHLPVVYSPPAQFTTLRTTCTLQTMPPAVLHRRALPQSYRLIHRPS